MAEETIGTVTGQPALDEQNRRTGATTTDPKANVRAADAGAQVDPRTGEVGERGPKGPELRTVQVYADRPVFVRVAADAAKRRLMGEDRDSEESLVLYLAGDLIPAEHRDLPTVPAVHREGVWVPEQPATRTRKR